jgi:predicted RNase H-like HicB family nuclease/DNA-binding XRE family transcriptional regulator
MRFPALVTEKHGEWLARFKGLPGCEARADTEAGILPSAQIALDHWLAAELRSRRTPPRPPRRVHLWKRERLLRVPVAPEIALPLMIRWARSDAGLTQSNLAKQLGVTQPRIAQLELPGARLSISTLQRVAAALNSRLEVHLIPLSS